MKRRILNELTESRTEQRPVALVTSIESGAQCLVYADSVSYEAEQAPDEFGAEIISTARKHLQEQRNATVENSESRFIVRSFAPPRRLVLVGAVHIAQALIPMAGVAGFQIHLIDPREAFSADARFPGIAVSREWPDMALEKLAIDASTAVVTLSHDPKIDDPALLAALASEAFYIGALGSKRTHAARLERLSALGIGAEGLARIHAPVGLHLGGREPAEIAVSILAQIIASRHEPGSGVGPG